MSVEFDRPPLYMGAIRHEDENQPLDGIDQLVIVAAEKMGSHVVRTEFVTFFGTNYRVERKAEALAVDFGAEDYDDHPELISV